MKNKGLIFFATDYAKEKYKTMDIVFSKDKKQNCPRCEMKIKQVVKDSFLEDEIKEEDLN